MFAFATLSSPASALEAVPGFIYKDAYEPGVGYSNTAITKKGCAECKSYFAIVAVGDCSVNTAAKNGNIKNVSYYDTYTHNILGFKTVKVTAYGN